MQTSMEFLSGASAYLWPFRQKKDVKEAEKKSRNILVKVSDAFTHTIQNVKKIWAKGQEFYKQNETEFLYAGITFSVCVVVYCLFENTWYVVAGAAAEPFFHERLLATAMKLKKIWAELPIEAKVLTATVGSLGCYVLPFRTYCVLVGAVLSASGKIYFSGNDLKEIEKK